MTPRYYEATIGELSERIRDSRPTAHVTARLADGSTRRLTTPWGADTTKNHLDVKPASTRRLSRISGLVQWPTILPDEKDFQGDVSARLHRLARFGISHLDNVHVGSHLIAELRDNLMPLSLIAMVLERTLPDEKEATGGIDDVLERSRFLAGFAGPWIYSSGTDHFIDQNRFRNQLHLRFGHLPSPNKEDEIYLFEQRFSTYLDGISENSGDYMEPSIHIKITTLLNQTMGGFEGGVTRDGWDYGLELPGPQKHMNSQAIVDCGPITHVMVHLYQLIDVWDAEWRTALRIIDEVVKIELDDVLDGEVRKDLMFDNSFQKSEVYFVVLQLLRISSNWVDSTWPDFDKILDTYGQFRTGSSMQNDYLDHYWHNIRNLFDKTRGDLLSEMAKKAEEIKSLRDGLFNASALQETTRATQINEYLFVFTVMTILYLPLSFVATLYGIDLFDFQNPTQKSSFVITTVVVSVATYIVAIGMVWYVRQKHGVQKRRSARLGAQQRAGGSETFWSWGGRAGVFEDGAVKNPGEVLGRFNDMLRRRRGGRAAAGGGGGGGGGGQDYELA